MVNCSTMASASASEKRNVCSGERWETAINCLDLINSRNWTRGSISTHWRRASVAGWEGCMTAMTRSEDLSMVNTSSGHVHLVDRWKFAHVASMGHKFSNFGLTAPPRRAMADWISWAAPKESDGGADDGNVSVVPSDHSISVGA